ncbi:MAG TPA: hypothetical protein VGI40_13000 [Pirellulaceae bacterium]|jgi:tetratricopeptide (TPR) repeat protein
MSRALWVVLSTCLAANVASVAAANGPAVVFLQGGRDSALPDGQWSYQGLLARELVRQSFLCAARDELGCSTLDLHLGQSPPAGAIQLDIVAVRGLDRADAPSSALQILKGEPPTQELIVAADIKPKMGTDVVELVRILESRSRGNGSFVKALQQAGIEGRVRAWNTKSQPDAASLAALAEMNCISQFRAVCSLHAQIEEQGRSPALIAALVRAYANLGVLTELHWAPAHKVFTARSLIYAQRLVGGKHDNTQAYTSRAYAFALAGLHQAALDDLDALDRLAEEKKAKPGELPRILRSYCRFKLDELDPEHCERQNIELVRLLRLLVLEHGGSNRQVTEEAMAVIEKLPHCYRVQQSLGLRAGVSLGHVVTLQAIGNTMKTLYPRLNSLADMPKDAHDELVKKMPAAGKDVESVLRGEFGHRAKIFQSLQASEQYVGKQQQLTWAVLGHLLAEHSFLETYIRGRFEGRMLPGPADHFLDLAQPLYASHPLAAAIDFLRVDQAAIQQAISRAAQIDFDTLEIQADDVSKITPREATPNDKRRTEQARIMALQHVDFTATDLLNRYRFWAPERASYEAARAYDLSPHAPGVRNHYVEHHWNKVEPQLEEWLRDAEGNASEQAALGAHYRKEKQWDKALEHLEKAKNLSPEFSSIRSLAAAYKTTNKIDKWQATLEELLQQPDYGLDHANVRVEIADYYISRHDYASALPFAVAAAGTGAAWALHSAGQCYEALQRWDEAEAMYRSASQGYQDFQWLCFVRRTGHGNLEEAKQWARACLADKGGTRTTPLTRYFVLRAIGDEKQALAQLEEAYRKTPDLANGLHLVVLTDERKDAPRRDAVLADLKNIVAAGAAKTPPAGIAVLVDAFSNDLAAGGKAQFDVATLLAKQAGAPTGELNAFEYFLGKYFHTHGNRDAADDVWLIRMSKNHMNHYHRTLCGLELLKDGVGPDKYKAKLQTVIEVGQPVDAPPK